MRCCLARGYGLAAVTDAAPVSAADGKQVPSIALALTSRGLEQIGLGCDLVSKLGRPFTEGMLQKERRRRLGTSDTAGESSSALSLMRGGRRETHMNSALLRMISS